MDKEGYESVIRKLLTVWEVDDALWKIYRIIQFCSSSCSVSNATFAIDILKTCLWLFNIII